MTFFRTHWSLYFSINLIDHIITGVKSRGMEKTQSNKKPHNKQPRKPHNKRTKTPKKPNQDNKTPHNYVLSFIRFSMVNIMTYFPLTSNCFSGPSSHHYLISLHQFKPSNAGSGSEPYKIENEWHRTKGLHFPRQKGNSTFKKKKTKKRMFAQTSSNNAARAPLHFSIHLKQLKTSRNQEVWSVWLMQQRKNSCYANESCWLNLIKESRYTSKSHNGSKKKAVQLLIHNPWN